MVFIQMEGLWSKMPWSKELLNGTSENLMVTPPTPDVEFWVALENVPCHQTAFTSGGILVSVNFLRCFPSST